MYIYLYKDILYILREKKYKKNYIIYRIISILILISTEYYKFLINYINKCERMIYIIGVYQNNFKYSLSRVACS